MAEGLLKHLLSEALRQKVTVRSAGTYALYGKPAEAMAIQTMAQYGVDISRHRARPLDKEMLRSSKLILVMERFHLEVVRGAFILSKPNVHLLGEFAPQPCDPPEIDDPYGQPLSAYLHAAEQIQPCVQGVIDYLQDLLVQAR